MAGDPWLELAERAEKCFWLELREPGCVPERKGSFLRGTLARTLREFMDARPEAKITVVTLSTDGPAFQDAPEALMMADWRSRRRALRHIASSNAAFCRARSALARSEGGQDA
jgi:hypothetical protein